MLTFSSSSMQYVSLGSNLSDAQNISNATICAWVRCENDEATAIASTIFALSTGTSTSASRIALQQLGVIAAPDNMRAAGRRLDADAAQAATGGALDTNNLHWIVGEFRFTNRQAGVYVDTIVSGSTTVAGWTGATSNTVSLRAAIGASPDGTLNFFNGDISDVRLYNRVLTDEEKRIIYHSQGRDSIYWGLLERWSIEATILSGTAKPLYSIVNGGRNGETVNGPVYKSSIIGWRRSRL